MRYLAILLVGLCCVSAGPVPRCMGQGYALGPSGGFTTAPTLSPYLDLLRNDGGVLPNYQQFVRPRIQLRRAIQDQSTVIARQRRQIQSIDRQIRSPSQSRTPVTGKRAGYMNYSTFYPGLRQN